MMRCLRFVSLALLVLAAGCANPYRHLKHATGAPPPLSYRPVVTKQLYRCVVDGRFLFKKFHLSGLLFFKVLEDGSTRAVFQNELGFSFFDFRWDAQDSFEVVSIMPQLNKPALIKTLKKDMNLVLRKTVDTTGLQVFAQDGSLYYRFELDKGHAYYIEQNGLLQRIEVAGKEKVVTIEVGEQQGATQLPGSLFFRHHKAHFTIQLKKIPQDAGPALQDQ